MSADRFDMHSGYLPGPFDRSVSSSHPLDYLRVFWWIFARPRILDEIWNPPSGRPQTETRRSLAAIERWIVSGLIFLPYLIVVLAFGFRLSRPAELLWILAPMIPVWVVSITWMACITLPDTLETSGCLISIGSVVNGLSKLLWMIFAICLCVAAQVAKHPLSAVVVISAAMLSFSIGGGIYRATISPREPAIAPASRLRIWLVHVRLFVMDWWLHIGVLSIAFCFNSGFVFEVSPLARYEVLFVASLAGPAILCYLIAVWAGRVLSNDGSGVLAMAARAAFFITLIGCYAVLIWVLLMEGWRLL